MKQNEEKQNKELEKNKRPRKNGQYRYRNDDNRIYALYG
jgi:hypothetical protein